MTTRRRVRRDVADATESNRRDENAGDRDARLVAPNQTYLRAERDFFFIGRSPDVVPRAVVAREYSYVSSFPPRDERRSRAASRPRGNHQSPSQSMSNSIPHASSLNAREAATEARAFDPRRLVPPRRVVDRGAVPAVVAVSRQGRDRARKRPPREPGRLVEGRRGRDDRRTPRARRLGERDEERRGGGRARRRALRFRLSRRGRVARGRRDVNRPAAAHQREWPAHEAVRDTSPCRARRDQRIPRR